MSSHRLFVCKKCKIEFYLGQNITDEEDMKKHFRYKCLDKKATLKHVKKLKIINKQIYILHTYYWKKEIKI